MHDMHVMHADVTLQSRLTAALLLTMCKRRLHAS